MALIIFDLDGTLVDSIEGLGASMNRVLVEFNLPEHPINKYMDFVGHGFEKLVEKALPDDQKFLTEKAVVRMRYHYSKHYRQGLTVYDGIFDLLDQVLLMGYKIGLITNKSQDMGVTIMKDLFDAYPWVDIIGRSDAYPPKPDPTTGMGMIKLVASPLEEVYMIGDTEVDIEFARNLGINEVFVSWGFRNEDQVAHLEPKTIIHHPKELLSILQNI